MVDPGVLAFARGVLPAPPARILEIGAGSGELAAALREGGHEVTAIDPEAQDGTGVQATALIDATGTYDAAIAIVSLHHVEPLVDSCSRLAELIVPGGRFHEQSKLASRLLNEIPGVSCVEPRGALYCFPRLDPQVYRIESDEAFVIDLLRAKKLLVTHGTGFNWFEPDHFRLVTLPDVDTLTEAIGRITDYLETIRD